jgi:predicted MFS family arabinose efflux permease
MKRMTTARTPWLIWVLMLGIAVVGSNSLALSPILGNVALDLETTSIAVGHASAAYGGATALSALVFARLLGVIGPHKMLCAALGALTLAMVGSAAATHLVALVAFQVAAGTAAGVILPATYALATSAAPAGRDAEYLGKVLTGWSLSMVVGVPLSAWVAHTLSWRASYIGFAVLLAAATVTMLLQPTPSTGPRRDAAGMRVALSRPGARPLLLICLLFMTAFYGVYTYVGDHVRQTWGLNASEAGLIALAYGLGFGLAAFGDRFIDRIGAIRLFPLVLMLVCGIYTAMLFAASWMLMLALAVLWGLINHAGLNILVLLLRRTSHDGGGAILALNSATTYVGALLGASLFGGLYDRAGFSALGWAAAVCMLVSGAVSVVHLRGKGR